MDIVAKSQAHLAAFLFPHSSNVIMSSQSQLTDLSTLFPSARRLITIYPDREVISRRSEEAVNGRLAGFTRKAGRIYRKVILGPVLSIPVERLIDKIADKVKGPPVLYVTHDEVRNAQLKFPPGHPIERTLYAVNPVDHGNYLPVSTYHHMVFEHKFAEVVRLLVALGASNIVVEHEQGWAHEFASNLKAPVPEKDMTIGLTANAKTAARSKVLLEARFSTSRKPRLPDNLAWYPHEELWKNIAESRLNGELDSFSLKLSYMDNSQIDTQLVAQAQDAGIEIGGAFQGHTNTSWSIRGKFSKTNRRKQ